jgi:hypothetical protein
MPDRLRKSAVRVSTAACVIAISSTLFVGCRSIERRPATASPEAARILSDIVHLADDRLEGRGTGTAGNDSAAAWLAGRHASLGLLAPIRDSTSAGCPSTSTELIVCRGFIQRFMARGIETAHAGRPEGYRTQNVVAVVPGSDSALRREYVVIGAHFDHLGRSPASSMDPEALRAIRNGADDNASGTAAALELARLLAARPARRSVVIAHFSAEELGLLGSQWFVEHSPVPIENVVAMVNFDMVGRLRDNRLIVYGVATARELPSLLDSANVEPRLRISAVGDGFGPSDHSSFYAKGIPVLHFFTDLHDDYHKASDDSWKINADGTARIVALAERLVRAIADRPQRITPARVASTPRASSGQGSNVYLGTIPDMAATESQGLRLSGVRAGSPADQAGLAAGDVIVGLGGRPVKDLYSYSDALYAHRPGQQVEIVFRRDGAQRSAMVTLGRRGQ